MKCCCCIVILISDRWAPKHLAVIPPRSARFFFFFALNLHNFPNELHLYLFSVSSPTLLLLLLLPILILIHIMSLVSYCCCLSYQVPFPRKFHVSIYLTCLFSISPSPFFIPFITPNIFPPTCFIIFISTYRIFVLVLSLFYFLLHGGVSPSLCPEFLCLCGLFIFSLLTSSFTCSTLFLGL